MAWAIEGGRSSDERPERVCDKGEGASKSALACVRLLLARPGAVADKESGKGHDKSTPLARAVSWLDDECVEELLAAGADPNKLSMIHVSWLTNAALCIGNQMNTPLASAISRGDAALFGRLLAAGADPNLKALWSPSVEEIAERCRHAGSEAPALVRSAKAAWAARQEARAIEEAAEPGSASARAPRM